MIVDHILEKDILPDFLLRTGIKFLLKSRLKDENKGDVISLKLHQERLIEEFRNSPLAINTMDANEQHYEVPADFFRIVLGPWLKYSSGFWFEDTTTLQRAEEDMLNITIDRAELEDGQNVLDLGCGWGSFSLYAAEHFPNSNFTAVSNAHSQRKFIEAQAKKRGITNLKVITADINTFKPTEKHDRIVSVEMFEHVRNYELLFDSIHSWLSDNGKLFVHIFNHRKYTYKFEVESNSDWMAKYFFTGGLMPSDDLFFHFSGSFKTEGHWQINGKHYAKTLESWLKKMDNSKAEIMALFETVYGVKAKMFWSYWRIFFLACAETFAYKNGNEWGVSHYLFKKI